MALISNQIIRNNLGRVRAVYIATLYKSQYCILKHILLIVISVFLFMDCFGEV